jgi:hypothetical protein
MIIEDRPYTATFTIDYVVYMAALQKGIYISGTKLTQDRQFVYKRAFRNYTRKKAVNDACQWYWKALKGNWGQAHVVMTLGDHYKEVRYNEDFSCADKSHRYLDESTILLLLKEANGELMREESVGAKHHPTNSVRRIKRRRVYLQQLEENIYQHPTTRVMYYAATVVSQKTANGKVTQRRKRENFKLASKDLDKAHKEIERRFEESPALTNDSPNPFDSI